MSAVLIKATASSAAFWTLRNELPTGIMIHVFLDNARYHHAKLVREWLAQPGRRIKLHFVPAYCPHLNPIERLWGAMHKHLTHNKTYATLRIRRSGAHLPAPKSPRRLAGHFVIRSPTTSASSTRRIFGFCRE
ncbi:transposase [Methylocystis iwaonis]|uniref:transposase n=1 Tax=Methylocystis iwaonis TaxID=2885079 RepID=UPI003D9CB726